ncbi:MAG: PIN domain-containing protein [Terrimicrobiaceae bacterium]
MSWLLDADVLSQPARTQGNRAVIAWLEREQDACYTSTIVIAQIAYWVRTKEGRTRTRLQQWLRRSVEALEGRILSFNVATAHVWADQKFLLEQAGQLMPVEDSYIAATARRHDLTIVTGNDKDFRRPGLKILNPFKELENIES